MPGLTLRFGPSAAAGPASRAIFSSAQESMCHDADSNAHVALAAGGLVLGGVAAAEYPLRFRRTGEFLVGLEGWIRGMAPQGVLTDAESLAAELLSDREGAAAAARRWVLERDGDYLIVLATLDGKSVAVLTDALGRLPLYFSLVGGRLAVAREPKFLLADVDPQFDRLACAQYLCFGYPLGERTLFEGIRRAPPAWLLRARDRLSTIDVATESLVVWNLEDSRSDLPLREAAAELAHEFRRTVAMVPQVAAGPIILALSGGHDSRSVAAAFDGPAGLRALSFRRSGRAGDPSFADARVASVIASRLGIPWEALDLVPPESSDEERLVRLKDGSNHSGLAFLLPFLETIRARWGRGAIHVTGDWGDSLLKDRRPAYATIGRLDEAILAEHGILSMRVAETALRLPRGILGDELRSRLDAYPETDPVLKAVRFRLMERGRNWYFEGEDRARFFANHVSPFTSFSFARLAMRIPQRAKAHFALYREFQKALHPLLLEVENADAGIALASPRFGRASALRRAATVLPPAIRAALRKARRRESEPSSETRRIEALLSGPRADWEGAGLLEPAAVRRLLRRRATAWQFHNWRTLHLLETRWRSSARPLR